MVSQGRTIVFADRCNCVWNTWPSGREQFTWCSGAVCRRLLQEVCGPSRQVVSHGSGLSRQVSPVHCSVLLTSLVTLLAKMSRLVCGRLEFDPRWGKSTGAKSASFSQVYDLLSLNSQRKDWITCLLACHWDCRRILKISTHSVGNGRIFWVASCEKEFTHTFNWFCNTCVLSQYNVFVFRVYMYTGSNEAGAHHVSIVICLCAASATASSYHLYRNGVDSQIFHLLKSNR